MGGGGAPLLARLPVVLQHQAEDVELMYAGGQPGRGGLSDEMPAGP